MATELLVRQVHRGGADWSAVNVTSLITFAAFLLELDSYKKIIIWFTLNYVLLKMHAEVGIEEGGTICLFNVVKFCLTNVWDYACVALKLCNGFEPHKH